MSSLVVRRMVRFSAAVGATRTLAKMGRGSFLAMRRTARFSMAGRVMRFLGGEGDEDLLGIEEQ